MATAAQIEKEFIEWHNSQEDAKDSDYFEPTEYFSEAWGNSEYSIYENLYAYGNDKPSIDLPSGKAQIIRDIGGEGEGDTRTVILTVGEQYFEINGYYASWDGDNWESATLTEVEPKEVKVIRFFPKEG